MCSLLAQTVKIIATFVIMRILVFLTVQKIQKHLKLVEKWSNVGMKSYTKIIFQCKIILFHTVIFIRHIQLCGKNHSCYYHLHPAKGSQIEFFFSLIISLLTLRVHLSPSKWMYIHRDKFKIFCINWAQKFHFILV